jgi:hypothetical protein
MREILGIAFCVLLVVAIVWVVRGALRAKHIREVPDGLAPPASPFVRWLLEVVEAVADRRAASELQLSMAESAARRRRLLVVTMVFVGLVLIGIPLQIANGLGWTP